VLAVEGRRAGAVGDGQGDVVERHPSPLPAVPDSVPAS
jgi:hypothetical protein